MSKKIEFTMDDLADMLIQSVEDANWEIHRVVIIAASLELEYVAQIDQIGKWQAQRLWKVRSTMQQAADEDQPFSELLRQAISSRGEKVVILTKQIQHIIWVAVLYKQIGDGEHLEKPITFALSEEKKYLFSNKIPHRLLEAIKIATECIKIQPLKLSGTNVGSLLTLLRGREGLNHIERPIFAPSSPNTNEVGTNFSQSFEEYTKKCISEGLHLNQYVVEGAQSKWLGDDAPELRLIEFKHEISFRGDVPRLLASLPQARITQPPFPDYIRDFSVLGRSKVTTTSCFPC